MADISVDFDTLRLSVLRKAVSISSSVSEATLGPNSPATPQNSENNKNTANVSSQSPRSPKQPSKSPTSRTRASPAFSLEKILHENEIHRQEEVRKVVNRRKQEMEVFEQKLLREKENRRLELVNRREREMAEQRMRVEAQEAKAAQQEVLRRRHEAQLQVQRVQERKEKLEREAAEYRRRMEHEECLQRVHVCRLGFSEKCREVAQLAESMKNKSMIGPVIAPYMRRLKEMKEQIDGFEGREVGKKEAACAEAILGETEEILVACKAEVVRINEMVDEMSRREAEARAVAEAEARACAQAAEATRTADGVDGTASAAAEGEGQLARVVDFPEGGSGVPEVVNEAIDEDSINIYLNSKNFLEQYQMNYRGFIDADPNGTYRKACEKVLNIQIKRISSTEGILQDIISNVQRKFGEKGDQELAFCKNFVADTLVDEVQGYGDQNPRRIHAMAGMAVALWSLYPDFGELLIAHLHMRCPYTVPVLLPRLPGQSNEEFYTSRGYTFSDGVMEDEKIFYPRMEKFMRFYCAIMITQLPKTLLPSHPHGLANAWKWLARILNVQPQKNSVEICGRVIRMFLEVTGDAMMRSYPTQFKKLLKLLSEDYLRLLVQHAGAENFSTGPLDDFLSDIITRNAAGEIVNIKPIAPPSAAIPRNAW